MEPNVRVVYDPKKGRTPPPSMQHFEQMAKLHRLPYRHFRDCAAHRCGYCLRALEFD